LICSYQADVAELRAGIHESQTQRETFDAEAKRYKVRLRRLVTANGRVFGLGGFVKKREICERNKKWEKMIYTRAST